jgi:hypothetical protein
MDLFWPQHIQQMLLPCGAGVIRAKIFCVAIVSFTLCFSKTWTLIEGLEGHTDQVFDVSWIDNSTLISASHDGTIRM